MSDCVEVIRCKDCKHWNKGDITITDDGLPFAVCSLYSNESGEPICAYAMHYCWNAERRDDETDL